MLEFLRTVFLALVLAHAAPAALSQSPTPMCMACYSCGQYPHAAISNFGWKAVYGNSPGEALAAQVAQVTAIYVPRTYCSFNVALDGSKYPIQEGSAKGFVYGATETYTPRVVDAWGNSSCGPQQTYPYRFGVDNEPWAYNAVICKEPPGPSIELSGPAETKPRGTSGWRELMLTARVMQGGAPAPGKAVTFKLTPKAAPDGHQHGDLPTKPAGSVANGSTDATGVYKVAYFPSEFAGIYTVEASCDGCGEPARMDVTVRVPGLVELTASTRRPPAYTLIGQTATHPRSHYFSGAGLKALMGLMDTMRSLNWTNPGVNDASLVWGGRFDIAGRWSGSHAGHRDGDEVDISFYRPAGVSQDIRNKTYDELAKAKQFTTPQALWHLNDNPDTGSSAHFHIYLSGQKVSSKTPY